MCIFNIFIEINRVSSDDENESAIVERCRKAN